MSQAVQYMKPDAAFLKNRIFNAVSGYMPAGRHYGFIYNEFNNTRTIFHELGHCQGLSHMAKDTSSDAQQKSTNLMGYGNGWNIFNWQIETLK